MITMKQAEEIWGVNSEPENKADHYIDGKTLKLIKIQDQNLLK